MSGTKVPRAGVWPAGASGKRCPTLAASTTYQPHRSRCPQFNHAAGVGDYRPWRPPEPDGHGFAHPVGAPRAGGVMP